MLNKADLMRLAERLGGLPVHGTLPGSPAERAGIRYGDVLLFVDGIATSTWDEYLEVRRSSGPTIELRLFRDGATIDVTLTLDRVLDRSTALAGLGLWGGDGPAS